MGTDIHLRVQYRDGDAWAFAERYVLDEYHERYPKDYPNPTKPEPWYDERNYDLFAILADVRNGYGFAGVETGMGFVPIAEQRGFPDGFGFESDEFLSDGFSMGDHSHSWLLASELFDYDWSQVAVKSGLVTAWEYESWRNWNKEHGRGPRDWCDGVGGLGVVILSEEEMAAKLDAISERTHRNHEGRWWGDRFQAAIKSELDSHYTRISWTVMYGTAAGAFYQETMPRLKALAREKCDGDLTRVRIVYGFDS